MIVLSESAMKAVNAAADRNRAAGAWVAPPPFPA
jgi:hypothetical protein